MRLKIILMLSPGLIACSTLGRELSWATSLKNKIVSQWHLITTAPLLVYKSHQIQKVRAEEQHTRLHQEVEEILKKGSTVQETATEQIHEKHQKALRDLKKCACISDKKWNKFLKNFEEHTKLDPLFNPNASQFVETEEDTDAITNMTRSKLRRDNLNIEKVKIEFPAQDFFTTDIAFKYNLFTKKILKSEPTLLFNVNLLNTNPMPISTFFIEHEIKHLKQNHAAEDLLLGKIIATDKKYCLNPFTQQGEFEADALAGIEDLATAQGGKSFFCSKKENWDYFLDSSTHPSHYERCKRLSRITMMLEIEKSLKEKQKTA